MVHLELTSEQRRELHVLSRQGVGRVALRAQMVLLSGRGCPVPQIALIHACGEEVVRTWLHRYQRLGVAGLYDLPKSGRPPTERLSGSIVDAQASQSPRCSGHPQACWSVGRLTRFLARRFRLLRSVSSVRRDLHQMGWRWARPRLAPAAARHPDPEAAAKVQAIAAAWTAVQQGLGHLLFLDESDLHLLPVVRAMWMKGRRVRVPTPGQNARRAFFGALEAIGGQWHWADHERKLAVHFVTFLDHLLVAYPFGALYLVLDNAPTHTATLVARWAMAHPRAQLLWLPTYAAHEANPVERIWGLLKSDVAADRLEGNLATLVGHARQFCAELAPHPVKQPAAA
jgi:transposase